MCRIVSTEYDTFVRGKLGRSLPTGIPAHRIHPSSHLFGFQNDLVSWALRRGRAALFAATGLGKTRMQVDWAAQVEEFADGPVLILAPLAVAQQTVAEADAIGVKVQFCRTAADMTRGINITNYDRLHLFKPDGLVGLVLDESSCIKHHDAKTLAALLDFGAEIPFKLAATATPAPNDYTELGTHAEFLGVCKRQEMLAEYFVHDGGETQTWRLKGHARRDFWRFVASWGALVRMPSDLGYSDEGYVLPPLKVHQHVIPADAETTKRAGLLFAMEAGDLMERRAARRASIKQRVEDCAMLVGGSKEPWVVWCNLNAESDELADSIPGAVEIRGSMSVEEKEDALERFASGETRVLISKTSITGFGLNWQHCANTAFVGVDDSWESYYQAVRRFWRFGQTRQVNVHVFASEAEGSVIRNLERKERDALAMADALAAETRDIVRAEVRGLTRDTNEYSPDVPMVMPAWLREEEP